MVRTPNEAKVALDNTEELPALDFALYEEELGPDHRQAQSTETAPPASSGNHGALHQLPLLPPVDTLRDIEAWIEAQETRARTYERTIEDLQQACKGAEGRADILAGELDAAQSALRSALSRANEAERAALASEAQARAAESRAAESRTQLEERSQRVAEVERELAASRAQMVAADGELAQRAERIAAMQAASATQQAGAGRITRERDALALRIARLEETAQSNEWQRAFSEVGWGELDSELADSRALLGRIETERGQLAATVDKLAAELSERDAAIGKLSAERAAQASALSELSATRSREQQTHTAGAEQLRLRSETLAAEIKTLEQRQRITAEALAAREAELAVSRAERLTAEETLRTVQASDSAHTARVAELESLAAKMGRAVEAQIEAVQRANSLAAAREKELADERTRVGALEDELRAAAREIEDEAARQSERLAGLQAELAHARTLAEQAEPARAAVENELVRVRSELQREIERADALDAAQRNLALELERTRGALDERDLQVRRLERYASNSTQLLNRIRVGIARDEDSPHSEAPEFPDFGARLVPLDDSDAPAVVLGRHTTIGRASESDLCLKDCSVSRRHAVLTIEAKGAFIEDLRSVNGVLVNRRRIRHERLVDGDVIELGVKRFLFTSPRDWRADRDVGAESDGERVQ